MTVVQPGLFQRLKVKLGLVKGRNFLVTPAYPALTVANLCRRVLSFSNPLDLTALLDKVNTLLKGERALNSQVFTRRGALIELKPGEKAVLIGDLHGNVARLDEILRHYGPQLVAGQLSLVFLGDYIHSETAANAGNMAPSFEMLNAIIALKEAFPERVHLLLGNHDCLSRGDGVMVTKRGVIQGIIFYSDVKESLLKRGLTEAQAREAIEGYQTFFDNLPLALVSRGSRYTTFAAHVPVVVGGAGLAEIAAARENGLINQLLWNSFAHANTGPGKHFGEAEVRRMSEKLALTRDPQETLLVSGHVKGTSFCYRPFSGQPNFLVVHSNVDDFGVVLLINGHARPFALNVTGPRV